MSKYTRGPYRFEKLTRDDFGEGYIIGPNGETIAHHGDRSLSRETNLANGKVLGATWDLLDACAEFVRKVDAGEARSTRSYAQMKAAIAKATGDT